MNNRQAMQKLSDLCVWYSNTTERTQDDALERFLASSTAEFVCLRQLAPALETLLKAWLERNPGSMAARSALIGILASTGQAAEAQEIERGEEPAAVDVSTSSNTIWEEENFARSAKNLLPNRRS